LLAISHVTLPIEKVKVRLCVGHFIEFEVIKILKRKRVFVKQLFLQIIIIVLYFTLGQT